MAPHSPQSSPRRLTLPPPPAQETTAEMDAAFTAAAYARIVQVIGAIMLEGDLYLIVYI